MDAFINELDNIPENLCKKCGKCCNNYPDSLWGKLPDGCGYEGWIFKKQEEKKQQIRKQKEKLLDLEILLKSASETQKKKINQDITRIKNLVKQYAMYGAKDW